jgi:iron complex outermembrane recepter protein
VIRGASPLGDNPFATPERYRGVVNAGAPDELPVSPSRHPMTSLRATLVLMALVMSKPRAAFAQESPPAPTPAPAPTTVDDAPPDEGGEATVRSEAPRRAASDYTFDVNSLRPVPRSSAADLLSLAPGFFLSQHGGDGKAHQLFLRGFDADHGQDVEFNVGGAPINEVSNVHGQGYADLNFMIPEVVDRVRVLEGPYDPRQGDFAVAGSARFDLGVADRGALLRASYGMFNTQRLVGVLAPRGERRETFLAGELARTDGYGQNRASSRAAVMAQYGRELAHGATLRVLATSYAARWDSAGVVRDADLAAGRQGFYDTNDTRQGGFSARHGIVVEVVVPRGLDRTSVSLFGAIRELRVRENYTGYLLDARGDRYEQTYDAVTVGMSAAHRHGFRLGGLAQAWEVGLFARHDITTQGMHRQRAADDVNYAPVTDADVDATDIGLYGDVELRLMRTLSLRGGLRADGLGYQIDDRMPRTSTRVGTPEPRGRRDAQGFQFGPRATIEWEPLRGLSLIAAYGKGFRSPQALSLGEGESAPFATVHSGEVGVRYRGARVNATVTGFGTHVDRDLVFEPTQGQNLVNDATAATTRLGVAASVRVVPVRGLEVVASGTWARATYDATGNLVPYVPPLVGRLDATFQRVVGHVFAQEVSLSSGLGVTTLGPRALPFSEFSNPVLLIDLGLSGRIGPVELGVSARNLTNAQWEDGVFNYASNFDPTATASRVPARHFSAGRPLTVLASLTLHL